MNETSNTHQEDQIAPVDASSSRRGLLRLAGAAAAGVVGATVLASRPAAATNGLTTADSSITTVLNYLGNQANHTGFLFQAGTVYDLSLIHISEPTRPY